MGGVLYWTVLYIEGVFDAYPSSLTKEVNMDVQTLTSFFKWCMIINGGLLLLWSVFFLLSPNLVYQTQNRVVPLPRETWNVVMYSFLGFFKVMFIIFNLVPWLALLIIA
ncbi:MAG: DUF6868 family protein [Planctomycetota bacterium]|jgi:hypothetical protein